MTKPKKVRAAVSLAPHVHMNATRKCAEMGIDFSAGVSLALTQWAGTNSGPRVADVAPDVRRSVGRPPKPPPPIPPMELVVEALIAEGLLPAGAKGLEWEATCAPGEFGGHLEAEGHPLVSCWGINELQGVAQSAVGLRSDFDGWIKVDGVSWHMPELVYTLVHGAPPSGRLNKTGECWSGCHTCWRPSHYTVGTKWFRFWKD